MQLGSAAVVFAFHGDVHEPCPAGPGDAVWAAKSAWVRSSTGTATGSVAYSSDAAFDGCEALVLPPSFAPLSDARSRPEPPIDGISCDGVATGASFASDVVVALGETVCAMLSDGQGPKLHAAARIIAISGLHMDYGPSRVAYRRGLALEKACDSCVDLTLPSKRRGRRTCIPRGAPAYIPCNLIDPNNRQTLVFLLGGALVTLLGGVAPQIAARKARAATLCANMSQENALNPRKVDGKETSMERKVRRQLARQCPACQCDPR